MIELHLQQPLIIVLILDDNSEHAAHPGRLVFLEEKNPICNSYRSSEMPSTDRITEIPPHVRTYYELPCCYHVTEIIFWVLLFIFIPLSFVNIKKYHRTK